jgi:hypothetical protein
VVAQGHEEHAAVVEHCIRPVPGHYFFAFEVDDTCRLTLVVSDAAEVVKGNAETEDTLAGNTSYLIERHLMVELIFTYL